jgi:carboxyl-terminal processing protease
MRATSFVTLGVALGVSGALVANAVQAGAPGGPAGLSLFRLVFEKASANYAEAPDATKMTTGAINAMLSSLDPHSNFLDAKALKDFQNNMRGEEFGGLGLEVMQDNGLVRVVSPIDDTPAARAGVLAGDMIVKIDATAVKGLTLKEAVDKMRGPAKTHVTITVQRGDLKDVRAFDIVREIIHVQPVRSRVQGGDLGYIRITQFNEQTYDALKAAIAKFKSNGGVKGYILDLRNNPGGLLSQSIRVVNTFIDSGEIVSTRGRTADLYQEYNARSGYNLSEGKQMVVLINGGSASASEIVSGALQDLKRATLIGTRSFGKGSVQTVLPLGEDGALKLTTARYYTPSGRSIQAKGIEPDYKISQEIPEDLKGKVESLGEASLQGHLKNGTDEKTGSEAYVPPDPLKDTQLQAAIELLHGRPPIIKASNEPAK